MTEFHSPEHAGIAKRALDGDRLLEGEDPESHEVEDARHWIAIYGELIGFKENLLAQMRDGLPRLPAVAASEVQSIDIAITHQQMERYVARRDYWTNRSQQLVGEHQTASH